MTTHWITAACAWAVLCTTAPAQSRSIPLGEYRDRLRGGWVGQMAGLGWGYANGIEFRYRGQIVPDAQVPVWQPGLINDAYRQPIGDDCYVETSLLVALHEHGVGVPMAALGEAFKSSGYSLFHANQEARDNLHAGLSPPESGFYGQQLDHAPFGHSDDIDWQIEADFIGLCTPGQVNAAIDLAFRFGHVMNYGDGVIGGVVMAAMSSTAFVAQDVGQIIEAGRQAAPPGSKYRAVIEDVLAWYTANPGDWRATWSLLQARHGDVDRCPSGRGYNKQGQFTGDTSLNIDAKLNGAYVFMGLLYGQGDFIDSVQVTLQCGQDTDSNCQNVGAILGAYLGEQGLPPGYLTGLDETLHFDGSDLRLAEVLALSEEIAREIVLVGGGTVQSVAGQEVWTVPVQTLRPPLLEQWPDSSNPQPQLSVQTQVGMPVVQPDGSVHTVVTFDASVSDADGILGVEWHFGDLHYQTGRSVSHTYTQDGDYEAMCMVADAIGNTRWQLIPVHLDDRGPEVITAASYGDSRSVQVVFDEPLDPLVAEDPATYQITPSRRVLAAQLQNGEQEVLLSTASLDPNITYQLDINGIRDDQFPANSSSTSRALSTIPVQQHVLTAVADAGTRSGNFKDVNFGTSPNLPVNLGTTDLTFRSLLKFDLSAIAYQPVLSARLRLWIENEGTSPIYVSSGHDDSWQETQVTWNLRPSPGAPQGTLDATVPGAYATVDVTRFIAEEVSLDQVATFQLYAFLDDHTVFASRESTTGQPPQLVVEVPDPSTHYGAGLAGTGGKVPRIDVTGSPFVEDHALVLQLSKARARSPAFLLGSFTAAVIPARGGFLLNDMQAYLLPFQTDAQGKGSFAIPIKEDPPKEGYHAYFQFAVLDPGAVQGVALTDGLRTVILHRRD